ncbi:MAG: DUF6603 domain-containing protein [Candidatus Poseidoniaceae archaeon]
MIPSMSVVCSSSEASAAPAVGEIVAEMITSIENSLSTSSNPDLSMPTHLGMGVRFGLASIGGDGTPGHVMDLDCRIDILSIDLNGSNTPAPNPTPAVHIEAELWKQGYEETEDYLVGSPEDDNRLRSIDVHLHWNQSSWSACLGLNDAAYNNHVDWSLDVPGRLEISTDNISGGAMECVDYFLAGYSAGPNSKSVDTFLQGLYLMGLVGKTVQNQPVPYGVDEEILWWLDGPALNTFIADPEAYIQSLFNDAYGNIDFGKPLPNSGKSLFNHLGETLEFAEYIDDPSDSTDGHLLIELGGLSDSLNIGFEIGRYGEIGLAFGPLSLGPVVLSARFDMAVFDQASWLNGPSIEVRLDAIDSVSGMFENFSIVASRSSPWAVNLNLPMSSYVPVIDNGISWDYAPSSVNLLDFNDIKTNLLPTLPGMIFDSVLQMLVERLLIDKLGQNSPIATILCELDVATREQNGTLTANSLYPLLQNPVGHLQTCFLTSSGFDTDSVLNVFGAILQLFRVSLTYEYETVIDVTTGDDSQRLSAIGLPIGPSDQTLFWIKAMSNPNDVNSFTLAIQTNNASIGGDAFGVMIDIRVNIRGDLSVDLDNSSIIAQINLKAIFDNITSTNQSTQAQDLLNVFSDTVVELQMGMSSGQLHSTISVDFDVTDQTPPSILTLMPTVSGVDGFLRAILGDAMGNILPKLLTKIINTTFAGIEITSSKDLDDLIINLLTSLSLWNNTDSTDEKIDENNFTLLCADPSSYLRTRFNSLLIAVMAEVADIISLMTDGSTPIFSVATTTNQSGDLKSISLNTTATDWKADLCLNIGYDAQDRQGVWICFSPTLVLDQTNGLNLEIEVCAGMVYSQTDWSPMVQLTAYTNSPLVSVPLEIHPIVQFTYESSALSLELSTSTNTSGTTNSPNFTNAFWAKLLPLSGTWQKGVDWGMPNLSGLLLGAANTALDFLDDLPAVQEFFRTPIYSGTPQILSDLTIVGDWLVHLGICSWDDPAPSPPHSYTAPDDWRGTKGSPTANYTFRPLQDIIAHFQPPFPYPANATNAFDVLLVGAIDMFDFVLSSNGAHLLYSHTPSTPGKMEFEILLDWRKVGDTSEIGVIFNVLNEIDIGIGNLNLQLFTQDAASFTPLTNSRPYNSGFTVQFLKIDKSPTATSLIQPFFSFEVGNLALKLEKNDGKPLIDGFLLLSSVTLTGCVDLTFTPTFAIEGGARLDLDDFGIALGGDGSSDGGNGMAAGVLSNSSEEGDAVRPTFDLAVWKYTAEPVSIKMHGATEAWFPINKQFGPIKIAQIGVRIDSMDYNGMDEPRIAILVDGEAEIAGFLAVVDDLSVSLPLFRPTDIRGDDSNGWMYDMAGCAISYTGPAFAISGALRKTNLIDQSGNAYVEYQGLCTISTSKMSISAIGAFGRVPTSDGDSYVTCFVIAALDYPLGGIPEFFVTGLAGGLGLNRDLVLPDVTHVQNSPFMLAMDGFSGDPMGALDTIRTALPAKHGSLWFAVGVKFTTYQLIETKAVLFVKISDGFTIGILGMSSLSLPDKQFSVGYVELAFLAYYDSTENLLWVEAQLTDASYLFSSNCRLTGGFALVSWFSRGEFLLSLGGYHPDFKKPSYYPAVPRVGFIWKPMSKLTVSGGCYFTLCSSAVMLGGSLEASFKHGKISASFFSSVDVLVVFDPFYYKFSSEISVSVRWRFIKGRFGVKLVVEGPKMRGKATVDVGVLGSFTIKFGPDSSRQFQAISFGKFVNKHVLQLPEGEITSALSSKFADQCFTHQVPEGLVKNDDGQERAGSQSDPWVVETEFELVHSHIFPASHHVFSFLSVNPVNGHVYSGSIDNAWRTSSTGFIDDITISPCGIDEEVESIVSLQIIPIGGSEVITSDGISAISQASHFPETLWKCTMENGKPKARTSPSAAQPKFLSGMSTLFRSIAQPSGWLGTVEMKQVEETEFIHNLPLRKYVPSNMPAFSAALEKFEPQVDFITSPDIDDLREHRTKPIALDDLTLILAEPEIHEHNLDVLVVESSKHLKNTYQEVAPLHQEVYR